jgi:hypothetical protein
MPEETGQHSSHISIYYRYRHAVAEAEDSPDVVVFQTRGPGKGFRIPRQITFSFFKQALNHHLYVLSRMSKTKAATNTCHGTFFSLSQSFDREELLNKALVDTHSNR